MHFLPLRTLTKYISVLKLVQTDVMLQMKMISNSVAKYVLTIVDNQTQVGVAYFIYKKSEVDGKFIGDLGKHWKQKEYVFHSVLVKG